MSESFAELFEQSHIESKMRPGTIVSGEVIDVGADTIIVNAGLKSEAFIPSNQFYNEKGELEVSVGDEVEVALDSIEDGFGETLLSREKAKSIIAWDELEKAYEAKETVEGVISERIKGGFAVEMKSVRTFLPGSLVDIRAVRDISYLEGKTLKFKIIKMDRHRNNVVVSRRAVIESENTVERDKLLDSLKEGANIKGIVKNMTDYGAFLDLGGIDGLLHITDMSWKRIKNPGEIVSIGDEIEVRVLQFDRERSRVSLGLKQLGKDPWVDLTGRYPKDSRLCGTITNLADYGCFVELEEGVEGLVHVSEMDWTNKNLHPSKLVNVGDSVDVVVLDINEERRRISLGMKQCRENPWKQFAADHKKGDRVVGTISAITDFGIFVSLEGGMDGLSHLSDISWSENADKAIRNYKKGEQLETLVLAIDADNERISLGIKQLKEDPFSNYIGENPKGAIVKGVAKTVEATLLTVQLAEEVEGQCRNGKFSAEEQGEDDSPQIGEGDEIEVRITAIDRKKRTINVSLQTDDAAKE